MGTKIIFLEKYLKHHLSQWWLPVSEDIQSSHSGFQRHSGAELMIPDPSHIECSCLVSVPTQVSTFLSLTSRLLFPSFLITL